MVKIVVIIVCLLIGGCAVPQKSELLPICPGKATITQAQNALAQQRKDALPVKANGKLTWRQYDGGKKPHQENLDIRLRFCPPDKLYFRGDILGSEMIRLGRNEETFWLRMKPKEVSQYWWGSNRHLEKCNGQFMLISPNNLIEAFGIVNIEDASTLSNAGGFDILTIKGHGKNEFTKKLYINCCDYRVRKIEYITSGGAVAAVIELDDYTQTQDNVIVPAKIRIAHYNGDVLKTEFDIKLTNVKLLTTSQKKLDKLFSRPEPRGIKNVFELNADCKFIRQ